MTIGVFSHSASAVAFLVLGVLLLTRWRGHQQSLLLAVAVLGTMLWSITAMVYAVDEFRTAPLLYYVFEVLRPFLWLVFLCQLLKPLQLGKLSAVRVLRFGYPALTVFIIALLVLELYPQYFGSIGSNKDIRIVGHIALAIAGLIVLEQLFRNTRPDQRWATKFLYLGIGTLFAYDFYLYADALLFKQINVSIWASRGLINAMIVPLLAFSIVRNPQWSLDMFVSRRVVIHTAAIFGSSIYLMGMAAVGYYISHFGGNWGSALQLVFMVGAGLLLLILMFSGHWRANVKLFFSRHFFNYKYDYREEWLKFNAILSTEQGEEPLRERAIRAIAEILHSPGGLLWTRSDNGYFHLTTAWKTGPEEARPVKGDSALIDYLERYRDAINIDEYQDEPENYPGLRLPEWMISFPRGWLIVPLMRGQQLQGFVLLMRSLARQQITYEDRNLLGAAGQQVASFVALLDATDALLDARQFDAFNRLSAYVVHDLKNIVAQLSLIVNNAARHKHNPEFFDDVIRTVDNTTSKMNRMLAQLRSGKTALSGQDSRFDLKDVLTEAVMIHSETLPIPEITVCESELILHMNRDRLTSIFGHLIQNSQQASARRDTIEISAVRQHDQAVIAIRDQGCGMDDRFIRERLFRPFDTTKGNAGMGIGAYEVREFVHEVGGNIEVCSQVGTGTTFTLYLPLDADPQPDSPTPDQEAVCQNY